MPNRDLTPWSRGSGLTPFGRDPVSAFRREMDRLFEDFLPPGEARSFAASPAAAAGIAPAIDLDETDQAYTVTAELAGVDQKDIELSLRDNALTLSGEKRSERKDEAGGRSYSERTFGRFERTIPFPAEVDADRVEATCENGVLKVTLPKNPKAQDQARRIEIRPQAGNGGAGDASARSGAGGL